MNFSTHVRRIILGAGLSLGALAPVALGGATADAQPAPPTGTRAPVPLRISSVTVRAGGTEAMVYFITSEPAIVSVDYTPTAAAAGPVAQTANAAGSGIAGPIPAARHELRLTGLTSNTLYQATITARTGDNRTATAAARFTTAKKRIRLVLDEVTITKDGDWFGKGEPTWYWSVFWPGGTSGGCFPNTTPSGVEHLSGVCQAGSYGEGTFVPRTDRGEKLALIFAEENFPAMPDRFSLSSWSSEEDLVDPLIWLVSQISHAYTGPDPLEIWAVPQDKEWASASIRLRPQCDGCSVESTMLFHFDLFHDNLRYPPNHGRKQVHSNF